jgi:hypothetical protein
MTNDFPAAHSMDTCFFAIDRDGHVACFDSHESGAVPVHALTGPPDTVRHQLFTLPHVEVLFDPLGHMLPRPVTLITSHRGSWGVPAPIIMFLNSLDPVRADIAEGRAVQLPASEGVAVAFRQLSEDRANQLHDSGVCLVCSWHIVDRGTEEFFGDWATRGLFYYAHLTENWISGPYGRQRNPTQPLHIDQLPPHVREALQAMRFESLCFADTPHIQPIEHAPCKSWEASYVDVGYTTIRPIPGQESGYGPWHKERAEFYKDLHIEPPPGKSTKSSGE